MLFSQNKLQKLTSLFLLFSFFNDFLFVYSHYNNFFIQQGVYGRNLSYILIAIQLSKIITDIPIGIIADLYNRRVLFFIGLCAKIIFCITCISFKSYNAFLIAACFWGIGMSCIYYHTEVYIYDSLKRINQEACFASLISKYYAIQNIAIALSAFCSSYIINYFGMRGVFLGSAFFCLVSILILTIMPKIAVNASSNQLNIQKIKYQIYNIISLTVGITKNPLVLRLLTSSILFDAMFIILIDMNTTLMTTHDIPATTISIIVGLIGSIRIFTNYFSGYSVKLFNFKKSHLLFFVLVFGIAFTALFNAIYLLILTSLYLCIYPFFDTSMKTRIQAKLQPGARATIMSATSITVSIFVIFSNLLIGHIVTRFNYTIALFAISMLAIAVSELIRHTAKAYKTYRFIKRMLLKNVL